MRPQVERPGCKVMKRKTKRPAALPRIAAPGESIDRCICVIRGERVMLDADLAAFYGVPTKRLNEQVRRNPRRFPADFAFVLTKPEAGNLRSHFATSSSNWGGRRHLPRAFTEHGALMAAAVLNSKRAVQMSVLIVRAFCPPAANPGGQYGAGAPHRSARARVHAQDARARAAYTPHLGHPGRTDESARVAAETAHRVCGTECRWLIAESGSLSGASHAEVP